MGALPTEFDLIVIGTGLSESIVAAAASRIGKTVLHIDSKEFYGSKWASFNLETIENLSKYGSSVCNVCEELPDEISLSNQFIALQNVDIKWHVRNSREESADEEKPLEELTKEDILKQSRRFNIDLVPKLHFARGAFVELLISSNIARYSEFRSVSRILTFKNEKFESIPCSRSDIFTNSNVNVLEKRLLMKLVECCLNETYTEFEKYAQQPFKDYLKEKKFTDNLIHYIIHAIAMSPMDIQCSEGVAKVKRFMESLNRYGKTPFLYAMFGSGELPQAFCRLCAVFGGVYALNLNIKTIEFSSKEEELIKVKVEGQEIKGKHLITSQEYIPRKLNLENKDSEFVSRAIFVTDKSLLDSESEHLSLLLFPNETGEEICTVIEAGSQTGTTPKGFYLVHMTLKQKTNPQKDFEYYVKKLFNENGPKILWSCYFSLPLQGDYEKVSDGVYLVPGPDMDLDYDATVQKAEELFKEIYPDEEFLPRAPDPEEIVFAEDEETETTEAISKDQEVAESETS